MQHADARIKIHRVRSEPRSNLLNLTRKVIARREVSVLKANRMRKFKRIKTRISFSVLK